MTRLVLSFALSAAAMLAQFKIAAAGAPAAEAGPMASALQQKGYKLTTDAGATVAEVWFVSAAPGGGKPEDNVTLTGAAHGSLLGVIKFSEKHADRRGQTIKPGTYAMRFSYFPQNGDHQGVAPQRDFMILTPIGEDTDPKALPDFEKLMTLSRKASGTPHPLVLSFWKEDPGAYKEGSFEKMGEHDMVLQAPLGGTPVSLILVGKAEG